MTAKKRSLLAKGVLKKDFYETSELLQADNVDNECLQRLIREVAGFIDLPEKCEFAKDNLGENDVKIFDFSKKQQSTEPSKIVEEKGKKLLVALVGDALVGKGMKN